MQRSLFLFLVCIVVANGCVASKQQPSPSDFPSSRKTETCHNQTYECLKVFGEVYAHVQKHYVDEVDRQSLIHAAIKEMLNMLQRSANASNLDSYTHKACSTDYECLKLFTEVLTEIQKQYGRSVDLDQVVEAAIRGMLVPLDSQTIFLKTEIDNPVKSDVPNESVLSKAMDEKIGYIRITQFEEGTPKALWKTLLAFQAQGILACILDLRNNPGGLVTASVEAAELFLGKKVQRRLEWINERESGAPTPQPA